MNTVDAQETGTAERLTEAAGERAKAYVDAGVSSLNVVSGKARQLTQRADDCVRENPWLAIGAAAGAGLLLGFLLRGRRDS